MTDPSRLVRNAPLALSVVTKHAGRGRQALTSAMLRSLPRQARPRAARVVARLDPVAEQLAVAAAGNSAAATEALVRLGSDDPAVAVRAADALLVLHRPDQARHLLEALPEPHPAGHAVVMASLLAGEGRLREALAALGGARGTRARTLRAQLAGDLEALEAGRRTGAPRRAAAAPGAPGPVRNVLHLVTTALPEAQSGYTIRTQSIAEQQVRQGLQVQVASRLGFPVDQGHPGAAPLVRVDGVMYHRLLPARPAPAGAGARLDLAVELVDELVTRTSPGLLHAHSKHDNAQVAIAVARRHGLPVVYEVRGFLEETWRTRGGADDTDFYRLSQAAELECMLAADQVVTLSRSMRDHMVARGVAAEKVTVVPNAVADDFLAEPPAGDRAGLGIPDDALVVGFSGTVNAYEGLATVVRALAERSGDPLLGTVHLLVVGSGPALAEVKQLAAPLGERAHFTGRVPHARVRELIAAMDLFVVPRAETPVTRLVPPLKHLEAMALGVPVLASDLPPLREGADDSGCIELARPDDPSSWAEAIARELSTVEALRERGAASRNWVLGHRSWSRVSQGYRVVYEAASTAHPVPRDRAAGHSSARPVHSEGSADDL